MAIQTMPYCKKRSITYLKIFGVYDTRVVGKDQLIFGIWRQSSLIQQPMPNGKTLTLPLFEFHEKLMVQIEEGINTLKAHRAWRDFQYLTHLNETRRYL